MMIVAGAVALSLAVSAAMLAAQGKAPMTGIWLLFQGGFGSKWALEDSLLKAIPIFLCSLGVGLAFRLQVWNIGAEGQFALGAVGATWPALAFPQLPAVLLIPAMMGAAMIAGGLWGMIPGLLKTRLRVNEIIITLMLNYIAILLLDYLCYGPWKDPVSFGFPMSQTFSPQAVVGTLGRSRIHWGLFFCIGFGLAMWIFFRFTRLGYELRASGENPLAARYAGIPYQRLVVMVLVVGGGLAGFAGFLEASANLNRLQPSIMVGYGYTAIIVAWLARLNPLQIAVAAYLLAGLRVGVENLQLDLQVPAAFGGIVEGLILLSVLAGGFFNQYRLRFRSRS
jgi:simple sugar transport system permease protein